MSHLDIAIGRIADFEGRIAAIEKKVGIKHKTQHADTAPEESPEQTADVPSVVVDQTPGADGTIENTESAPANISAVDAPDDEAHPQDAAEHAKSRSRTGRS